MKEIRRKSMKPQEKRGIFIYSPTSVTCLQCGQIVNKVHSFMNISFYFLDFVNKDNFVNFL